MNSKITQSLWLVAAVCFFIAGLIGRNKLDIIFGCGYICIFLLNVKKTKDKDDLEK